MKFDVGKAIVGILSENNAVHAIVGNKIFPLIVDVDTTFPFIVYKKTNSYPATSKDLYIFHESLTYELIIASDKYDIGVDLAKAVYDALIDIKGQYNGIEIIDISESQSSEDYVDGAFIQDISFNIKIN